MTGEKIETDFRAAATIISNTSPNDPIANSFAQYTQYAFLRCSATNYQPPSTTSAVAVTGVHPSKRGFVSLINNSVKKPDLVLTRWVDSEGVVRTRNTLNDPATPQEHVSNCDLRRLKREVHRAFDILVNKDDIQEHLLLNSATVEALKYHVSGEFSRFMEKVLEDRLVTSDLLVRIGRGPIYGDWMIKQLIFDAVMESRVDFNKGVADNAVAATTHFM